MKTISRRLYESLVVLCSLKITAVVGAIWSMVFEGLLCPKGFDSAQKTESDGILAGELQGATIAIPTQIPRPQHVQIPLLVGGYRRSGVSHDSVAV